MQQLRKCALGGPLYCAATLQRRLWDHLPARPLRAQGWLFGYETIQNHEGWLRKRHRFELASRIGPSPYDGWRRANAKGSPRTVRDAMACIKVGSVAQRQDITSA